MQRTLPYTPCTCNSRQLFLFSQIYYIFNKGQWHLVYYSPWDCKELDTTTEWLNNISSLRRKDWPVRFVSGLSKFINLAFNSNVSDEVKKMAILFLTSVVRSEVAIHIHSLDKREFRSSLQKVKQVSDNQRKLCYNRIILMELRKEKKTTQKTQK